MTNLKLIACGMGLPKKVVTNEDMAKTVDTSDEWIYTRTGIRARRFCDEGESNFTMALEAAKNAIAAAGITPDEIGCVVCATFTPDYLTPSLACLLQLHLGLSEDIPALDVNSACTGFIYATTVARGFLDQSDREYALVLGVEQLSRVVDMTDRATCVLFGDGGAAAIYKKSESAAFDSFLGAKGSTEITCGGISREIVPSPLWMNGKEVFRFAVGAMYRCITDLMERNQLTWEDVDHVVCHQANARIIDRCIHKLKAPEEKFYKNMDHLGNTSAASIPLAIAELEEAGRIKAGDKLLLIGFGGGLTWGGALITYGGK
ncbi:MAG: beta-ketoacyl-ACP synthase 3 [Lachnospiraceae bacterium]|nr:beta-ketoacyl-ACP synthase 3 [Lachnospiraceae bacterium]